MLKKLAAEYNFRRGRRTGDVPTLQLAAKQNFYNSRAAFELARLGVPDQICLSLLLDLAGLRTFAQKNRFTHEIKELLQLAIRHLEDSRGQFFQDIAAWYFSQQKHSGFFVEVGTGNGEDLSNTFMLEKCFNWQGILFEPDRRFHSSIQASRTATLDTRAVFSSDGCTLSFLEVAKGGELSSLAGFNGKGKRHAGTIYPAQTVTLTTALAAHQAPSQIDYMSIDTEGSELEVLKGLDLDQYDVKFFTIEHNLDVEKKQMVLEHLRPYGYREVCSEVSHIDVWLLRD